MYARALLIVSLSLEATGVVADITPDQVGSQILAVHCGRLVDTQAGKLLGATTVMIEGKRIIAVTAGHQVPENAVSIDLSSQTCLPGLIDSHTHLSLELGPTYYVDKFHWNLAD